MIDLKRRPNSLFTDGANWDADTVPHPDFLLPNVHDDPPQDNQHLTHRAFDIFVGFFRVMSAQALVLAHHFTAYGKEQKGMPPAWGCPKNTHRLTLGGSGGGLDKMLVSVSK